MKKKHFEYKGQMINYYNKVKNNPKVKMCCCYFGADESYTVEWCY